MKDALYNSWLPLDAWEESKCHGKKIRPKALTKSSPKLGCKENEDSCKQIKGEDKALQGGRADAEKVLGVTADMSAYRTHIYSGGNGELSPRRVGSYSIFRE